MTGAAPALTLGRPEAANAPGVGLTRWRLDTAIAAAGFTADGAHAAFGMADGGVRLVALDRFRARRMIATVIHDGAARALVADEASGGVLSLGADGRVVAVTGDGFAADLYEPRGPEDAAVALAAGGPRRAVATARGVILLDRTGRATGEAPLDGAGAVALSGDGGRLAAAAGRRVRLWPDAGRLDDASPLAVPGAIAHLAWSPDGWRLAAATGTAAMPCWHLRTAGRVTRTDLAGRADRIAWSACGRMVVGAAESGLSCWPATRPPDGRGFLAPARLVPRAGCTVTALACHPRHALAAAGFADGCVMLADLGHGRDRVVRHADGHAVVALAWSPRGSHLACAGGDSTAAVFDFSSLTGKK